MNLLGIRQTHPNEQRAGPIYSGGVSTVLLRAVVGPRRPSPDSPLVRKSGEAAYGPRGGILWTVADNEHMSNSRNSNRSIRRKAEQRGGNGERCQFRTRERGVRTLG